jgi:hypothetical protein
MSEMEVIIEIPVLGPIKAKEKDALISDLMKALGANGMEKPIYKGSYYIEKRGLLEPLLLVLTIIGGVADVVTIVSAIWLFLKSQESDKEINISVGDVKIKIKGNMSGEEIIRLVETAKKHQK